jgi:hypothetical protein
LAGEKLYQEKAEASVKANQQTKVIVTIMRMRNLANASISSTSSLASTKAVLLKN